MMRTELWTTAEWSRQPAELRSLGQVAALQALVRAGEATLAKWDTMSQSQQGAALEASEAWPQEAPMPEEWPEMPDELRYEGEGTPFDILRCRVRELQSRLNWFAITQRTPEQQEAAARELVDQGYISSFELALEVASGKSDLPEEMIIAIGDEILDEIRAEREQERAEI